MRMLIVYCICIHAHVKFRNKGQSKSVAITAARIRPTGNERQATSDNTVNMQ